MERLQLHLEALIFASETGISLEEIEEVMTAEYISQIVTPEEGTPPASPSSALTTDLPALITDIIRKYEQDTSMLSLVKFNQRYQFMTKAGYHPTVNRLQSHRSRKKLSQAAMETLAIIAYRQPITKLEVEHIRGVNCDYSIQRLLDKELIKIIGKSESVGRPLLYGTSDLLLEYFGLEDASQLPKLKDIRQEENSIGEDNT